MILRRLKKIFSRDADKHKPHDTTKPPLTALPPPVAPARPENPAKEKEPEDFLITRINKERYAEVYSPPVQKKPQKPVIYRSIYAAPQKDDLGTYEREDRVKFDQSSPRGFPHLAYEYVPLVGVSHSPARENFNAFIRWEGTILIAQRESVRVKGKTVYGWAVYGSWTERSLHKTERIGWIPAETAKEIDSRRRKAIGITIDCYFPRQPDKSHGMRLKIWTQDKYNT